MKKLLISLLVFLAVVGSANAGTYWVSPTGAAAWGSCSGATPLSGTAACSLTTANANAAGGDTVYLRAGDRTGGYNITTASGQYYKGAIQPVNYGTSPSNRITFAAYTGETVVLTQDVYSDADRLYFGIILRSVNYIKIDGITFRNFSGFGQIESASYNEITNCTFTVDADKIQTANTYNYGLFIGIAGASNSQHNWIHHNTIGGAASNSPCGEGADVIRVGHQYSSSYSTPTSDNNTIENNTLHSASHTVVDSYGKNAVIRNNVFYNTEWLSDPGGCSFPPMPNGKYGHRNLQITEDWGRPALYVLIEGNRVGWGSANPGNPGEGNIALTGPSVITRYNYVYGSQQAGIATKYDAQTTQAGANANRSSGGWGPRDNRIYNNTMYYNGHTHPFMQDYQSGCSTCPGKLGGLTTFSTVYNFVVKNNIAYDNYSYIYQAAHCSGGASNAWDLTAESVDHCLQLVTNSNQTVVNNWQTKDGNPQFNDTTITNKSSLTQPGLQLTSSSTGLINSGVALTTTTNSRTSATDLTVADALYFQDGTWGSALAKASAGLGGTFQADWIAIGTVGNVVQILTINYATNAIELSSPLTWSNGASIWLYKKSDGTQVLYGSAPDYGAYEYTTGGDTTAPVVTIKLPVEFTDTYSTSSNTISLAGSATDAAGVTGITWLNNRGGTGDATCTGCTGTSVTWLRNSIPLQSGVNVITISATDGTNTSTDTLTVTYTPSDTEPPVLSSLLPTGSQTCTGAGVANITLSLSTNEAATCKMATTDTAYASMDDTFTTTGGASHSETKTGLACGQTIYTYYVRCIDVTGNPNTSSETISFWITRPGTEGGVTIGSGVVLQ